MLRVRIITPLTKSMNIVTSNFYIKHGLNIGQVYGRNQSLNQSDPQVSPPCQNLNKKKEPATAYSLLVLFLCFSSSIPLSLAARSLSTN
jgi:hypothetical protein